MRGLRWRPWAWIGIAVLAWWYYAAPINLAKRIRTAVGEPGESSLVAARVDFSRVNADLSAALQGATNGRLDGETFAQLLRYGWLPQQRRSVPVRARQTRLYQVRYQHLNRFIAIFWDADQEHEVILTLHRESALHRWYVTRVAQFNVCAYDFDCARISIADLPAMNGND